MKKKSSKGKLSIEKYTVVEFKNQREILGGTGPGNTGETITQGSRNCPPPPPTSSRACATNP